MKAWAHQTRGINQLRESYANGGRRLTLVAPPGAGKSYIMRMITDTLVKNGKRVNIYLHRRMLTRQTVEGLKKDGFDFGVVAAELEQYANPDALIQICSMQTVASRKDKWDFRFPDCDFFFVDEKHQQLSTMAESVFQRHMESGATEFAFTATPVNLSPETCDKIVTPARYQDLLDCNAHLPVKHYCPDMPSIRRLEGYVSEKDSGDMNAPDVIVGNVVDHWRNLNPEELPTILFAPSVKASQWYCERFAELGITACHIDAEKSSFTVYDEKQDRLVVKTFQTNDDTRREVLEGSRGGKYKIVCNRFILREAIDMPWLYHGICCTTFSSVASYLQSSGRVLRYHPAYDHVIWQDHGGNLYRFGLINEERNWEIGDTTAKILKDKKEERQEAEKVEDVEGICCLKCGAHRTHGSQCPECGHTNPRRARNVRELDGTLKMVSLSPKRSERPSEARRLLDSSIFTYRALARKGRAYNATVGDVLRNAENKCRKANVSTSSAELRHLAQQFAGRNVDLKERFRDAFFPEGIK